jgi:hypothetical protein
MAVSATLARTSDPTRTFYLHGGTDRRYAILRAGSKGEPQGSPDSRYTPTVGLFRNRGISLVVLAVLAGLPVSGSVCAALCVPAVKAVPDPAMHDAAASHCDEPASGRPRVRGTSGHDCSHHDGAAREAASSLTAARADTAVLPMARHVAPAASNLFGSTSVRVHSGSSPPPGAASPTRTPFVLLI